MPLIIIGRHLVDKYMKLTVSQIKWQGKAHIHATWETNAVLASYRGIRKLENYYRKVVLQDLKMKHENDIPPEEKEQWSLDRERDSDALGDYVRVERVISMQEGEDGDIEYYVKCTSSCHCSLSAVLLNDYREGAFL